MASDWIRNGWRLLICILLQVLILQRIQLGSAGNAYFNILFYPIFLFLLPIRIPATVQVLIGFGFGLIMDMFLSTPGIHASASTFTAFIRPYVIQWLEPRGGYAINASPSKNDHGFNWYLSYISILLAFHLFFYFSVEAFTYVYFFQILLKTIISFFLSMLLMLIYTFLFNPR
ncbi:MAG: rod shape-determining protein MreD [Saprospiraceae bacterium]